MPGIGGGPGGALLGSKGGGGGGGTAAGKGGGGGGGGGGGRVICDTGAPEACKLPESAIVAPGNWKDCVKFNSGCSLIQTNTKVCKNLHWN